MMAAFTSQASRAFRTLALTLGLAALTLQGLVPLCLAGMTGSSGAGGAQSIVICTVHGYQTIQLDAEGNPVPGAPASDHGTTCYLCLGCHTGTGFTAPALAQGAVSASVERERPIFAAALVPLLRAHLSYVSRAPPAVPERNTA